MQFDYKAIEAKWQAKWNETKLYKIDFKKFDLTKKCYALNMFPYPSGDRLHVGHWFQYSVIDTWSRFQLMRGRAVFQPMGFDAFGLPAENYAIKTGIHPKDSTDKNVANMIEQFKKFGAMYDWDYSVETNKPEYYKWTQWLFLQLYKKGLAYKTEAPANWCDSCDTVLANEQVVDGECERCGTVVYKKKLNQWFFKITDYAEELLNGIDKLDWPEKTKLMQKNWIGKSIGSEIVFKTTDSKNELKVFTTRPDTLFGVTYVSIAPEHPLVSELATNENKKSVEEYIFESSKKTETERLSTEKSKTGVPTGSFVINPLNGDKVPIWVADYVLYTYGTGIVMAVPAHDERDFLFAKKYNLPIKKVILKPGTSIEDPLEAAYVDEGTMINSMEFNGLNNIEGMKKVTEKLISKYLGNFKTTFRLRDWLISRQRYWGAPIPIIYCDKCGEVPVPDKDLPVKLPYEVKFAHDGKSPLVTNPDFVNAKCPKCGGTACREVDTMDTFVCSSWYYLRYPDPKNDKEAFNKELISKMLPVDMYIGGAEHACMHLLYARFFTKVLADLKLLNFREPFPALRHQGTVLAPDGQKMSKSKGNAISPDPYVDQYGSDVLRGYMMFGFNYFDGGPWDDGGVKAIAKFLDRVWDLVEINVSLNSNNSSNFGNINDLEEEKARKDLLRILHNTIKCVTEDADKFQFNTSIARMMELINEFKAYNSNVPIEKRNKKFLLDVTTDFLRVLAPFAPHLSEELWEKLGNKNSVFKEKWPSFEPKYLVRDEIKMAIQINGKLRGEFTISVEASEDEVKKLAEAQDSVAKHTEGKPIKKIIVVKNKLVNFVV